jgi:hypothetical protein
MCGVAGSAKDLARAVLMVEREKGKAAASKVNKSNKKLTNILLKITKSDKINHTQIIGRSIFNGLSTLFKR